MQLVYIEAVLMDNDELIHMGKSLGFIGETQKKLVDQGATKLTKGKEPVVAIKQGKKDNIA